MVSPDLRVTMAFFLSGDLEGNRFLPLRRVLPASFKILTLRTVTLKNSSTACLTEVLVA